jgi:hypothetical protein
VALTRLGTEALSPYAPLGVLAEPRSELGLPVLYAPPRLPVGVLIGPLSYSSPGASGGGGIAPGPMPVPAAPAPTATGGVSAGETSPGARPQVSQ